MNKYIKLAETSNQYSNYINQLKLPSVIYCKYNNTVHYTSAVTFYVLHSSNKEVQKIVAKKGEVFNISDLVANNHFYGGIYTESQGCEGSLCASIRNGGTFNQDTQIDTDANIYDGSSLTINSKRYFKSVNVINNFIPENNNLYVLKEVPKGYYGLIYTAYTIDNNKISGLKFICNTDDNVYSQVKMELIVDNQVTTYDPRMFNSVTIYGTSYNSQSLFGRRGYVVYALNNGNDVTPVENKTYKFIFTITSMDEQISRKRYAKIETGNLTLEEVTGIKVTYYDDGEEEEEEEGEVEE